MISIMLVDDHAIVREGYRALLQKQADFEVVAEASNGEEAYQLYQKHTPDLIIMDISLPGQSGIETITRIKQRNALVKILVFSMHQNALFAVQAMQAGALAYVTKSSPADVLLRAINDVYANIPFLSADIAQTLALQKIGHERIALQSLSTREFEILRLLVAAHSSQHIARVLNISPKTVSNCHSMIKRKLNVNSDIELTHLAIKLKVIDLLELSGVEGLNEYV